MGETKKSIAKGFELSIWRMSVWEVAWGRWHWTTEGVRNTGEFGGRAGKGIPL